MTEVMVHMMRHGAPQMAGRLIGHMDVPADKAGVALCVERARQVRFGRVISSDLARASTPAAIVAAERHIIHDLDPRWRELHFGAWEGCDPADLPAEALGAFWNDPDAAPPPGGERWTDLCERIAAAIDDIADPVLVIAHAGAIRAALATYCGFDHRQGWAVDLPYGAVLSLRVRRDPALSAQIAGLVT